MKQIVAGLLVSLSVVGSVQAQEISEFRIGILGGENAQDRMNSFSCLQ